MKKSLLIFVVILCTFILLYFNSNKFDNKDYYFENNTNFFTESDVENLIDIGYKSEDFPSGSYENNGYNISIGNDYFNLTKKYEDNNYHINITYKTNYYQEHYVVEIYADGRNIGLIQFNNLDKFLTLNDNDYIYKYPKENIESYFEEFNKVVDEIRLSLKNNYSFSGSIGTNNMGAAHPMEWEDTGQVNKQGYNVYKKEKNGYDCYKKDNLYYYKINGEKNGVVELTNSEYFEYTNRDSKDSLFLYIKKVDNIYQSYTKTDLAELQDYYYKKLDLKVKELSGKCNTFAKHMNNNLQK